MFKKSLIIIALPLMFFAAEWQSLDGPPAGRADDMTIGYDPTIPGWVIYAADKTHKLYKSADEGELWEPIAHEDIVNPTCVITDENNAQVVYIGKDSDVPVWWSEDGGQTWEERSGEYPNNITNNNPLCFAMHPNNSSKIYLGCKLSSGQPEMFKTVDAGAHWSPLSNFPNVRVNDIAITHEPRRGTWIIAGCSQTLSRGIWLSTDGGDNWDQTLSSVNIYSIDFAHQFTGYAGSNEGVYKTTNGGEYWALLPNSPQYIKDLKTITTSKVYAATGSGMFMTEDGGATWEEINEGICARLLTTVIARPDDSQMLFAGGRLSIYKTIDGGTNWADKVKGYPVTEIYSVSSMHPYLYSIGLISGVIVYVSLNNGVDWYASRGVLHESIQTPLFVEVNYNDPELVYTGCFWCQYGQDCSHGGTICRTTNAGYEWQVVYEPPVTFPGDNAELHCITANPISNYHNYVYAGYAYFDQVRSEQFGFIYSEDAGAYDTWINEYDEVLHHDTVFSIAVNAQDGNMLYAGTKSCGVYKSTDNGDNWTQTVLNDKDVNALTIDFDYPDTLYAGSENPYGIRKTIDGGDTWIPVNNGLGNYLYIQDLEIDPSEPTIVYTLCKENEGATQTYVYCTVDRGGKWFNVSAGLPADKPTRDLEIDRDEPDPVYAATEYGVYTYTPDFNKSLVSSSSEATFKNNGRKICRIIGSDELWVTYESGGVIYITRSTEAGPPWSKKMELGQGYNPCISVNPTIVADPKPGVVWWAQGDRDTLYFARYISDNNWTSPIVIVTSPPGVDFGPPSFVIGTDNIGRLVYTAAEHPDRVYYTQFNIYDPVASRPELVGTGENPSIGFMMPGSMNPEIHVVWENNSTILYRSRTILGGIWSDEEIVVPNSNHPCLEIEGNVVHVVFEAFGDIVGRSAYYHNGEHSWSRLWTVCSTPNSSTYPVLTGGYACAWVEELSGNFEIYFSYYDPEIGWVEPINISNTVSCSNYPHITHKQTIERTIVYFTWTEGNSAPYDIKFQTYSFGLGESGNEALPFYVADGGEEEASPFNLRREGYHQYGTELYKRIDYDQEYLEYQFEGLNPDREYAGAVYLYQHGYSNLPILAKVDNYQIGEITLPSDTLIILKHMVPTMLYEDSTINIKIFGNNAVSAILVLYEYEVDSAGGGPQSSQSMPNQTGHLTLSVYPNPVKKVIGIEYNLPAKTDIKLSIFDVTGRLIKNIVSENQESGIFHKSFDITNLSQGVYFIRLNTRDKSLVEKVIFLK